jgi:hypothetical protein
VCSGDPLGTITVGEDDDERDTMGVPEEDALAALTVGVIVVVNVALSEVEDDADALLVVVASMVRVTSGVNEGVIDPVFENVASAENDDNGVAVPGAVTDVDMDDNAECV